jgi:hypothetical protein
VGGEVRINVNDFDYHNFVMELKDIPTGISKVVYDRFMNSD